MIRRPIPQHVVLVDSSILWCEDKVPAVEPKFDEYWAAHQSLARLELVVPDIVRSELLFQQTTSALKAREEAVKQTERVAAITARPKRHRLEETAIRNQVASKFDRWMKSLGATRAATPIDRINWRELTEDAVWRHPPFEFDPKNNDNEKGFRDALILETVID